MKKKVSTLDGIDIQPYRMAGNSTRQVDMAVDLLFSGFKVEVKDHHKEGADSQANRMLFDRVVRRLQAEHNLDYLIAHNLIRLNRNDFTMELTNPLKA